ncbi:D-amino-acid transaminase [Bacillus solimangrovi]|uniref:D-alanine aminotransferase n=1 Tax=Bacillus solimangrovi TaxID=1305675 RepID=A0A1E5LFA5_9BACI|nr:D-amino-acid transaminase [Bacillus solimangrovi]OEH92754.1 D-amino-acid transaminase [Bacillus solimangrovi]
MEVAFYNGKFIDIDQLVVPIDERGHNFGDGVYEVVRVYNGEAFGLTEHLVRLIDSAEAIRIKLPYTLEGFQELILEGIEKSGLKDSVVYLQVTRGVAKRQHLFPEAAAAVAMTIREAKDVSINLREGGASVIVKEDERWLNCYIKSLNLLPNILVKQEAADTGAIEAVLHRDGVMTEGSSSNLFIIKEGMLYTTPLSRHILAGITRANVLSLAKKLNIPIKEEQIRLEQFKQADEIFITSTTLEVMPIVTVDGEQIADGKPGKYTMQLQNAYQAQYK